MPSHRTFGAALLAASFLFVAPAPDAGAWSDKITNADNANMVCKLEPASQCTSAVLMGLQAPGVDMHESSMASMRLDNANLQGANLSRSILQLANLEKANLMLANLEGAHMHGVNLRGADLKLANLRGANLLDADFSGADLTGADLTGAILVKARFDHATWTNGATCAEGSLGTCRAK